jgi:uncharacterized protein YerC
MPTSSPLDKRFWAKVKRGEPSECWLWQGARNGSGHGLIMPAKGSRSTTTAHRVSWTLHFGPIPDGMYVLHDCDVAPCVNPTHLHLGTHADNMREASERRRFAGRTPHRRKPVDIDTIRQMRADGMSQQTIADALGIGQSTVSRVLTGVHWSLTS